MKTTLTTLALLAVMVVVGWAAESTLAPKVLVKLRLSAPDKMKAELTRQLRESFESIDGVAFSDTTAEYEIDVMAVDEPMGRVAVSCTINLPFNRSENANAFRTLLSKHWKGGLKDEAWAAFADFFAPYRASLLKQIQSTRKSKLPELCDGLAADFAQKVLKRDPGSPLTPETTAESKP